MFVWMFVDAANTTKAHLFSGRWMTFSHPMRLIQCLFQLWWWLVFLSSFPFRCLKHNVDMTTQMKRLVNSTRNAPHTNSQFEENLFSS